MTSELIERVALNLRLAGICHAHTHSVQIARAAISVIAPAVLEEAAGAAMRAVLTASLSKAVWDDVSALKTRYEQ